MRSFYVLVYGIAFGVSTAIYFTVLPHDIKEGGPLIIALMAMIILVTAFIKMCIRDSFRSSGR